jgi:hypothetical protein
MPIHPSSSTPEDAPGFTLDRIHAALERSFSPSDLSEEEQEIYFDLLGQQQSGRREAERSAFAKELMNEPGNVGYDEAGNLIRTLGGGQIEIIEPASGQKQPSD